MTDGRRVEELLADRPDLEDALAEIQAVDADHETWTFDDIPLDSGTFGQLVSEGVVEKVDGEYRLADPEAVRIALGEETPETTTDTDTPDISFSLPSIEGRAVGLLGAALLIVVAVRLLPLGSTFRDGTVVLSGNDPYFYRYWVEQLLADGGVGVSPIAEVPAGIAGGEPFLVTTLAWLSGLLGGDSGTALALYPVIAGTLTALMLYGLTDRVSADRRVALAAVVMLGVTPSHAFRTSLGYADHHAFDYLWLTLTALALVVILTTEGDRSREPTCWLAAVGLGLGITGQILAWNNGPLLVVPVAIVVFGAVLVAARADRSPLLATGPVLGGIALAAVGTYWTYTATNWHSQAVAVIPALLFAGSLAVVVVGEAFVRFDRDIRELAVVELLAGVGTFAVLVVGFPDLWSELQRGIDRVVRGGNIAEVQSLFGDSLGFLLLFGFLLALAVPLLAWVTVRLVGGDDEWLVPAVYGWYFLALSMFQVRFTGEFAPFTALFAGLGFVWLAAWVDLAEMPTLVDGTDRRDWWPERPDASTVASLVALFVLVAGLSVVQSGVKMQQVSIDDDAYETASYLDAYADERGWETKSESYVFSDWGRNRMHNYFVSGESRSYGYAQQHYRDFIARPNATTTNAVVDSRVRFLVTKPVDTNRTAMQTRLHEHYGSSYEGVEGLSRYRAIYATESGDRKAFLVVDGATLAGTAAPNSSVELAVDVSIPNATFTYNRVVETDASGNFSVRVAYPGTYELSDGNETWTVEVSESAVLDGGRVVATRQ